jgi:2-amino-4-hydroxy-6-hydroxymethyldihydropteridine diphosphokinase
MLDQTRAEVSVFVSLGSNIEPAQNLQKACHRLTASFGELDMSSVYRNAPVGFEGDDFLNMVVSFASRQKPEHILNRLDELEAEAGRVSGKGVFGPRTLDLDLLLYGELVADDSELKIPRNDIDNYSFVIGPLAELAPELRHPVSGQSMQTLWADFNQADHELEKVDINLLP